MGVPLIIGLMQIIQSYVWLNSSLLFFFSCHLSHNQGCGIDRISIAPDSADNLSRPIPAALSRPPSRPIKFYASTVASESIQPIYNSFMHPQIVSENHELIGFHGTGDGADELFGIFESVRSYRFSSTPNTPINSFL